MKVFCVQRHLDYAINVVNKAISPNNTLPVLNNILIRAEGKHLHFSCTNLEIAISCSIDAEVEKEGAITVPSKLISGYISLLSDQRVGLETKGTDLNISSKSSKTTIKGISSEEFPLIPAVKEDAVFELSTEDLFKSINETVFAASLNTSRPVLSGVVMFYTGDSFRLVATDSYRLAEKTVKVGGNKIEQEVMMIVPARTMQELAKIISKLASKTIKVVMSKNQVLFKAEGIEMTSRLIEGRYPDYKKIIPEQGKTNLVISVEKLATVMKRVNLFARENNNSVHLEAKAGKLVVTSDETKVGKEDSVLEVKVEGEENKISLNSQYLIDVLAQINDENVVININDKTSPAKIMPEKEEGYVYIIMPLKI
jgi:DNA polymerase-3 subunit beta